MITRDWAQLNQGCKDRQVCQYHWFSSVHSVSLALPLSLCFSRFPLFFLLCWLYLNKGILLAPSRLHYLFIATTTHVYFSLPLSSLAQLGGYPKVWDKCLSLCSCLVSSTLWLWLSSLLYKLLKYSGSCYCFLRAQCSSPLVAAVLDSDIQTPTAAATVSPGQITWHHFYILKMGMIIWLSQKSVMLK